MSRAATLRVGCAAGFSGDRTDAAAPIVESLIRAGGPACLIFETLAERTLALAQLARRNDPATGYEPLLAEYLRPVLRRCLEGGIRIVSNFGAANPLGAARRIHALARELGLPQPRVAVVSGDDISGSEYRGFLEDVYIAHLSSSQQESDPVADAKRARVAPPVVSANAYIGAEAIADALLGGAEIVVCGRVADPSLTVGPALAHFGWARDDWSRIAGATMAGHLLECGAQVTGGYYADAHHKVVPGLECVGYPIAEIDDFGACVISKPEATGGLVDEHIVKEQLLYEIHDPRAYMTPDVVADLSNAQVRQVGPDRVRLAGVTGHSRPETLKVNVAIESGWLAEGEISYAGSGAEGRARLAMDILRSRLIDVKALRFDLIGVASILGGDDGSWLLAQPSGHAQDVRVRVAANTVDKTTAERVTRELFALHTAGPAGGGGGRTAIRARLGTISGYISRELVPTAFTFVSSSGESS